MYQNGCVSENEFVMVIEKFAVMPDNVRLYTRCIVPKGVEKCPVIYMRTPYEAAHNGVSHSLEEYKNNAFINHGYAIVLQHCRGRGDSEGVCTPYQERNDGLATLDFIRSMPFYNGEIYVLGGSYLATVHLCYLSANPKDIKGACLQIQTDRMFYRNYRNGCNYRLNNADWWARMLERRFPEQNCKEMYKRPYIDSAKRVYGVDVPEFTEKLIHNICDKYWTDTQSWSAIDNLEIPTLFVEGWYDFYIEGMTNMWERMPPETKKRSAMFIGPFGHGTAVSPNAEYPLKNGNLPDDYVVEWFDSIRENRAYKYAEYGKITYYSIGADEWCAETYPKENICKKRFWFEADGTLRTECGTGGSLSYLYDPSEGTRYKTGNIFKAHKIGTADGILSFVSSLIEKEQNFFGKIKFHLDVSSDCEDTAFYMRVYFMEGDESYNLTETVGSLSYLVGDYVPRNKVSIELESSPIAFTLKEGMRIRVDISSDSGVYMPHPNVKGHFAYVEETKIAKNTVYTLESYIELPLADDRL